METPAPAPAPAEPTPVQPAPPEPTTTIVEPTHRVPEQNSDAWYQTLPEETARMLNDKDKQYKSFDDYIKATHELRGKLSEKGIIPPGENATEEERKQFLESIEPYIPSQVPEGDYELEALKEIEMPEEQRNEMFSRFKQIGLSNQQADEILSYYGESVAKDIEAVQAQREAERAEAEKALKEKWGSEFDARMERAATILDKLGDGFSEFASEAGLFTKPEFVSLLDKIGSAESVLPSGTVMAPKDIKARIDEIKADPKLMKGSYEERRALGEELRQLIALKNG